MIHQQDGETLSQAISRNCRERGHDFYRSHRCNRCNILFNEVEDDEPLPPMYCVQCKNLISKQLVVSNDGTFCSVVCHKEFTRLRRERNEKSLESFDGDFRFNSGRHIQ